MGIHHARLKAFADRADEVLMPEDAAELVAINAQLGIFLAHLPDWMNYLDSVADGFGPPEAERQAALDLQAGIEAIIADHPHLIGADAEDGLHQLTEGAFPEATAVDPAPVGQTMQLRAFIRGGASALRAFAKEAVAQARAGSLDGIKSGAGKATAAALIGITGYLIALATGLPSEFGWLAAVIPYLKALLGKTEPNAVSESPDDLRDV